MEKLTSALLPSPASLSIVIDSSTDRKNDDQEEQDFGVEGNRCQAIHEAINKFVVYEKFAEMTHKYDVSNFSKLLDDYNTADELRAIRTHLDIDPVETDDQFVDDGVDSPPNQKGEEECKSKAKASSSLKLATSYRFHFVQYQSTAGGR